MESKKCFGGKYGDQEIGDSARLFLSNTLLMSRIAGIGQGQKEERTSNPIYWIEEQKII